MISVKARLHASCSLARVRRTRPQRLQPKRFTARIHVRFVLNREQFQLARGVVPVKLRTKNLKFFFGNEDPVLQQGEVSALKLPRLNSRLHQRKILNLCLMIGMLEDQECGRCSVASDHALPRPAMLRDDFPEPREVPGILSALLLPECLNLRRVTAVLSNRLLYQHASRFIGLP